MFIDFCHNCECYQCAAALDGLCDVCDGCYAGSMRGAGIDCELREAGADAEPEEPFCMHGSCFTCSAVDCYTGKLYREHGKDAALEFCRQFEEMEDVD